MEYTVGTLVRSTVDGQGLRRGETYEVVGVHRRSTFVGTFLTYSLRSGTGTVHSVRNGHLVLEVV